MANAPPPSFLPPSLLPATAWATQPGFLVQLVLGLGLGYEAQILGTIGPRPWPGIHGPDSWYNWSLDLAWGTRSGFLVQLVLGQLVVATAASFSLVMCSRSSVIPGCGVLTT